MTSLTPRTSRLRPGRGPLHVLVVDDEAGIRELLSRSLGYEGWFVRTAATGGEAMQAASTVRPDTVVMALDLPDMDGPEVVRRLRSTSPCLPVVLLAAGNGGAGRVAGLQSGSDCLAKPFRLEELAARLHQLLPQTNEAAADRELVVVGNLTWTRTAVR